MSLVTYQDKLLSPGPNTSPPKPNPEPTVFPDQKVQLGLGLTHGPPPTTQPDQNSVGCDIPLILQKFARKGKFKIKQG